MTDKRILIVDDEASHRLMLRAHLEKAGYKIEDAESGETALAMIQNASGPFDLMLLDLKMPDMDGLQVLEMLHERGVSVATIMMTAYSSIDSALKAGRLGIKHYLAKPLDTDELLLMVEEILNTRNIRDIQSRREQKLAHRFDFNDLWGSSRAMLDLKEMLGLVAPAEANVLIMGESGTGKELVARAIHKNSSRRNNRFIAVNCAALPETLLESELFGHEKGAFTGAHQRKAGRFEMADQGTLLLDEIGEMALITQAKLLRVLEEQSFERVGGTQTLNVDVRVLAATNRDLEVEIKEGRFREDLYYRLNVVQVLIPSLRERGAEDIRELATRTLVTSAERNKRDIKGFTPRAMKALISCPWPGNVRELVNAVERAVILTRGDIVDLESLPLSVQSWTARDGKREAGDGLTPGMTLKEVEAELIGRTLTEVVGNRTKAAAMLGITRQTLLNKIREYNLE
jgi:two-component system, NtrC family, response regulator HydG